MKSWARWVLLIVGGLVAAALLGAGVLAYLVSRLDVRAEIERAVENATGRDMTIGGDVGVSFWPVLGLRAEEARLANAEGGRAPALATMDVINVGVEIRPLLSGDVVVRELVLQRPQIALEVDADGRGNWNFTPATPAPPPTTPAPEPTEPSRFSLHAIRITDGEISYYDARRGVGWVVGDADLETALTSLDTPMQIEGSINYAEQPIELEIEIAAPRAVISGGATAVKAEVESELLLAEFDGATTAASGEVSGLIVASGPSLRRLAAWAGAPIQGGVGLEAFAVDGRIQVGRGALEFSNAAFALDLLRGRGDFTLSQLRGKPYLSGRLEVFDFDLNPYLTGVAPPAPATVTAPAAEELAAAASAPAAEIAAVVEAPRRAIDIDEAPSQTPIDFTGLHAFNADVEVTTHAVLVQRMRIDRAVVALVINDGYLASTLHNITLYGGSARGRLEVDARQPTARIVQEIAVQGVNAQRFLSDAINLSNIEGRAELQLNLRAEGRTQQELVSGVDGTAYMEVVSGTLHGVDLGGVSRTIRNAVRGELVAPEARTAFDGFSARFAVADGALASDSLSFNTPDLRIPGIGVIDLNQRRLDMRLAPRAQGGGIVFPFSARGPWAQIAYAFDLRDRAQAEISARVREVQAASRAQAPAN
ncbi:MAG: AsmA family protein [Hyphomonadaceae bacterium]